MPSYKKYVQRDTDEQVHSLARSFFEYTVKTALPVCSIECQGPPRMIDRLFTAGNRPDR